MDQQFIQPTIVQIYNYAKMGLILGKNTCPFCNNRMRIASCKQQLFAEFKWKCTWCFTQYSLTRGSVLQNVNVNEIDQCIQIIERHGQSSQFPMYLSKYVASRTTLNLIRKLSAYYYGKKVRPFLRFNEQVEVDETKIGQQLFRYVDEEFIWAFGLVCRKTSLSVIYHVQDRKQNTLLTLIKKHCEPGTILYSDQASVYTRGYGQQSHLAPLGYYHFWINHTYEYFNKNFHFLNTMKIERVWSMLKPQLVHQMPKRYKQNFQHYYDQWCLNQIIKKTKYREMLYKIMRLFFWDKQAIKMQDQKWENKFVYSITHNDQDRKDFMQKKEIFNKDLHDFHELNQFMSKEKLNSLPDDMIDDSIHQLLIKQLRSLLQKDDQISFRDSSKLISVIPSKHTNNKVNRPNYNHHSTGLYSLEVDSETEQRAKDHSDAFKEELSYQISSISCKEDRLYASYCVQQACQKLIIPDKEIREAKNYSGINYLSGGYEKCGELPAHKYQTEPVVYYPISKNPKIIEATKYHTNQL